MQVIKQQEGAWRDCGYQGSSGIVGSRPDLVRWARGLEKLQRTDEYEVLREIVVTKYQGGACQWPRGSTIRSGQLGSRPGVGSSMATVAKGGQVPPVELECPVVGCTLGENGERYKTPPVPGTGIT